MGFRVEDGGGRFGGVTGCRWKGVPVGVAGWLFCSLGMSSGRSSIKNFLNDIHHGINGLAYWQNLSPNFASTFDRGFWHNWCVRDARGISWRPDHKESEQKTYEK